MERYTFYSKKPKKETKRMALAFNDAKGTAKKGSGYDSYTYKNGENVVRMFGGILARYIYWIPGFNNKNVPVECLSFDREAEAFTNKEVDHVKEFYPDLKCGWAYAIMCIDPSDGKVKILNLKKKLLQQVINAAEDLGDPTDPENGWAIVFKREKTGPNVYNVEYTLQPLKCKKAPLSEKDRELIANTPPMDEILPRQTAAAQREFLLKLQAESEAGQDDTDAEVPDDFDVE